MLCLARQVTMETKLTETKTASSTAELPEDALTKEIKEIVLNTLNEHSAQDTITIDIKGKSSVADIMIVTCGRSNRHVGALADYVVNELKEKGHRPLGIEGQTGNDWVLVDLGDVIVHIFRPEVRAFYNLEKIWSVPLPEAVQKAGEAPYFAE